MDKRQISQIVDMIDPRRVTDIAVALVDIPSPTGNEQPICEAIHSMFNDMGIESMLQEFEPGRYNTIGRINGRGDGATLLFNGHIDMSFTGDEAYLPNAPGYRPVAHVEDGWIHGMGIHNMKSGVAAFIAAAEAVAKAGPDLRGNVLLACVGGEIERHAVVGYQGAAYRGGGCGTKHFVTNGGIADFAVVGEPTQRRLVTEHVGSVGVRMTTRGLPAPLRVANQGDDALVKMKALFEVFEDYAADYQKRHRYRGRSGMVHMHSIEGGWPYRCNRVPIFCHAFMEFRILPHETMRDVPIEVERLANMARAVNPDVKFDVEYFVSLPSASVPEDTEIAKQVREAHALVEDRTPEEHMGLFFSDAAHLLAYGVPAVNYGPSGRTISGKANWDPLIGEHTSIEDIVGTARTYVAIMLEAGSRSRAELGLHASQENLQPGPARASRFT